MTDSYTADHPDVGDVLADRYRLDSLVGQGGMARVYRAHDIVLGRQVAVKLFRSGSGEVEDGARAQSETRLLAGLSHPSLVTLHDAVLSDEGPSFLVMEFVPGQTLREQIARGPLAPPEVAAAAVDLAEALHTVHAAGVVHRDIKPSNVLTWASTLPGREFRVKLADFGIAYLVDTTRLTTPGLLVGTAAYVAPEQVRGEALTPAADIYALGLVLLEALTGRRAYPEATGIGAIMARLTNPPGIPEALPAPWRELLAAMTATDPAARPTALDIAVTASTLPHASREPSGVAGSLLETAPMAPPSPVARAATSPTALAPVPEAAPTAATALLAPPVPPLRRTAAAVHDREKADARKPRRVAMIAAAIVVAVLLALGIGWAVVSSQPNPSPAPSLPVVEEPLGGHLDDLMDEVTP
jgi:serine/threonine protein kinase